MKNRITEDKPTLVPARAMQRTEPRRAQLTWQAPHVWPTSLRVVRTARVSPRPHRLESRMREIRPSGLEGGVRLIPHPYLYQQAPSLRYG